jgi:hypothetical protein
VGPTRAVKAGPAWVDIANQPLPIRATYLVRDPDGAGNALQYVIAFDVQAG